MNWLDSVRLRLLGSRNPRRARKGPGRGKKTSRRLAVERLEDRTVPTVGMVTDLYSNTNGSYPQQLTDVNGTLFFEAYTNDNTYQLFKSDGTPNGTQQLTFGNRLNSFGHLVNLGGKLVFAASDSSLGYTALWTSDGTVAGTHPFTAGGSNIAVYSSGDTASALVGSKLYFEGYDTANNKYDLWVTDGTANGTHPVQPGTTTEPTNGDLYNFTNVNGTLFFTSYDYTNNTWTLWESNGTAAGTSQVAALGTTQQPFNLTAVGSTLYFELYDSGASQYALWKATTSSASKVADIGTNNTPFYSLTGFSNKVWFQVYDPTDAPNSGWALWSSNGTAAGTGAFKFSGATTPVQVYGNSQMIVLGTSLYFNGYDTTNGYSLWKTDGNSTNNATGTVQITGDSPFNYNPTDLAVVGTKLFFQAYDSSNNTYDLWKSDGTHTGTVPVQSGPLVAQGIGSYSGIVASNGKAFFTAYNVNANNQSPYGWELWSSDGTAANTAQVKDINTTTNGSNPQYLAAVGSEIFFMATDNTGATTLYQSDGSAAGTVPVQTSTHALPQYVQYGNGLAAMGGKLYFTAYNSTDGYYELWSSGTAPDSAAPVQPGAADIANNPFDLVNDNGELYFFAYDGAHSAYALWKSDGSAAGTQVVADLPSGSGLGQLTAAGSTLFFQEYDLTNNTYALWKSDGVSTATQVADISASGFQNTTAVGNSVFFQAYDYGTNSWALWTSDGTTTTQLTHFASGNMVGQVAFAGKLFYDAYNPASSNYVLWMSDGTVAGTQPYLTTAGIPVDLSSSPYFTVMGGNLYFVEIYGQNLLGKTDGTPGGHAIVQGDSTGTVATQPSYLVNDNGTLVFDAYDPAHGYELWQSDGTSAGTLLAGDLVPGTGSSYPSYLTVAGSTVFFNATDPTHGNELWSFTPAATVVTAGLSGPADGVTEQHRPFVLTAGDSNTGNNSAGFSWAINWGDGTSQTVSGQSGLTTDHQYAAVGTFTVSVTATNLADGVTSAAVTQAENITQTELQGGNLAVGGVAGNDAFTVTKGTTASTYTIKVAGVTTPLLSNFTPVTGEEIILYPGNGTTTVTINDTLSTGAAQTTADTFTLGNGYVTFIKATVVVPSPATWTVNGDNGKDTFNIVGPANASINAGSGNDTFSFATGGSLTGTINGGSGTNTLTYAKYTASGVVVDLPLGSATGVAGGISNIQNVTGSANGGDILVGDANRNVLTSVKGHNILIGGSGGGDTLTSGASAMDILIAGSTSYDTNIAALQTILATWKTATTSNYATVVNTIQSPSFADPLDGPGGPSSQTVFDSGASDLPDTLNGNGKANTDWFFAHTTADSMQDVINNPGSGDITTSI